MRAGSALGFMVVGTCLGLLGTEGEAGTAYNEAVLADGPVYYWTFDQGNGIEPNRGSAGSGGGANDLTGQSAAVRVPSIRTPDGVSLGASVAAVPTAASEWVSGTLTGPAMNNRYAIELWVKTAAGGNQYLINHGNNPALLTGYNPCLEIFSLSGRTGAGGPVITDGLWHHVVVGVDRPSGLVTFYVDGISNRTMAASISAWGPGGVISVCGHGAGAMNGGIDDVALYNLDALDAPAFQVKLAQVAGHFRVQPPPASLYNRTILEDDPLYYWTFDETSGNALNLGRAGSGNGANELLPGAAGRIASAATSAGIGLGRCAVIGGSDLNRWLSGGPMTGGSTTIVSRTAIELWLRSGATGGQYLLANGTNAPALFTGMPDALEAAGPAGRTGTGGPVINDGNWHHIVAGIDSANGTHTFYVDGQSNGTFNAAIPPWATQVSAVIGGSVTGDAFGGELDEVAVYSLDGVGAPFFQKALADLASHYRIGPYAPTAYGKAVQASAPLYYWTFDEASGPSLNRGRAGSPLGNNDLYPGATGRAASTNTFGGVSLGTAAAAGGAVADEWFSGLLTGGAISNRYAIELWVRTAYRGTQYFLNHGGNTPGMISGWNPGLELYSVAGRTGAGGPDIMNGAWHHVVAIVDRPANRHFYYVDGVSAGTFTIPISAWPAGEKLYVCGSGGGNVIRGSIDELAVYTLDAVTNADAFAETLAFHYFTAEPPARGAVVVIQ